MLKFNVKIYLYKESEGGRVTGIKAGLYRPHIIYDDIHNAHSTHNTSAAMNFAFGSSIFYKPGETFICELKTLDVGSIKEKLVPGAEFTLIEGSKFVGRGIVLGKGLPEIHF